METGVVNRRRFLLGLVQSFCGVAISWFTGGPAQRVFGWNPLTGAGEKFLKPGGKVYLENLKEVMFYERLGAGMVRCLTCFRMCLVPPGGRGFCRVRENRDGRYYLLVYSKPSAIQVDPIEKEPQYHMLPGTEILCFGTAGCNFACRHCQNWHLSQASPEDLKVHQVSPAQAVQIALERNIPTISFTYNEPTVFYEYVYDIATLAKAKGIRILWHTNGAMNPDPLRALLKYTDAVTIDLKGFTGKAYENSSAELAPAMRTLGIIRESGRWLEIVNLVVPTVNDDPRDIQRMCQWIRKNLGPETPLHFSRFFPNYRLTRLDPTPVSLLEKARRIAIDAGIQYVTIGNVPGHEYNSTFCPKCGKVLIERSHFHVQKNNLAKGRCASCGHRIPGIWA
jgi:pyruvate formate lyase activating enzyme